MKKSFSIWCLGLVMPLGLVLGCDGSEERGTVVLETLSPSPSVILLRDRATPVQLQVTGITNTTRSLDLSPASEGTIYVSTDPAVATVSPDGLVTPTGPGNGAIGITNGTLTASVPVHSDFTPDLTEGDFDLVALPTPVREGSAFSVPLVLDTGRRTFGSYRVRLTYNSALFQLDGVEAGVDLGDPMAIRRDTPGEVEIADAHDPLLGPAPAGRLELARIRLRAIGGAGQVSIITGEALGASTDGYPATPLGPPTPRAFVTGIRRIAIVK